MMRLVFMRNMEFITDVADLKKWSDENEDRQLESISTG